MKELIVKRKGSQIRIYKSLRELIEAGEDEAYLFIGYITFIELKKELYK